MLHEEKQQRSQQKMKANINPDETVEIIAVICVIITALCWKKKL